MLGEVSPADPRYAEGIHHRCETLGRPDRDRDLTGLSVCFSARAFAHRALTAFRPISPSARAHVVVGAPDEFQLLVGGA
jgi:hypothetical protein